MRIILLGNHEVPYSTESHHAWTWEHMEHQVTRIQENKTNSSVIFEACRNADLFQWTHTHGWSFSGDHEITPSNIKIPSFSYHLDRYFGIGSREKNYLQHPSFHLDWFFSTDGGNEDGWKAEGINHRWLLPGCVEYGCYIAPRNDISIPVLFAGSVGYHSEYPFRPRMVQALQANYGEKFQVKTGFREESLNTLYSTTNVVVGDHIFAGCPRYCSDRLMESTGRGAFIIYPSTPGITEEFEKHGLVTYEPQNTFDLISKIDYYLDAGHEKERRERQKSVHEYVKNNHTYTHRLTKILNVMGF